MIKSGNQTRIGKGLIDLINGASLWRIWSVLAWFDIKARYRRSIIGQFWITLSMAVTICCLSIVYSVIFKIELAVYLPLMAVSFIAWGLLASLVNEGATVFIEAENYVRSSPLPKSMYIYRMLTRNLIVFAHNLAILPVVMVVFGILPNLATMLFAPALILTILNGGWVAILLGTFCSRFRDMPQIVASVVQIAFFVSPVMWGRTQLGENHQYMINFNPFAIFLELLRQPLLGRTPDTKIWVAAIAITLAGYALAIPFFARFRGRIAYYM
jgi:ABC-type polysaccharide/polyol phosphate export permease